MSWVDLELVGKVQRALEKRGVKAILCGSAVLALFNLLEEGVESKDVDLMLLVTPEQSPLINLDLYLEVANELGLEVEFGLYQFSLIYVKQGFKPLELMYPVMDVDLPPELRSELVEVGGVCCLSPYAVIVHKAMAGSSYLSGIKWSAVNLGELRRTVELLRDKGLKNIVLERLRGEGISLD